MPSPDSESIREDLRKLHQDVDREAVTVAAAHGTRLQCRLGCSSCCVDEITVFEVEAQRILEAHADWLAEAEPHPPGACAFLDDQGACRIYDERPYVCRTQGLPLRWIDEDEGGAFVERRDICPLNDESGPPIEELHPEACWTIGPIEAQLATLQARLGGRDLRRIALRDLFG